MRGTLAYTTLPLRCIGEVVQALTNPGIFKPPSVFTAALGVAVNGDANKPLPESHCPPMFMRLLFTWLRRPVGAGDGQGASIY
jgi:hypothetical protein